MRFRTFSSLTTAAVAILSLSACESRLIAPTAPPAHPTNMIVCPIDDPSSCDPPPPPPPSITTNPKFGLVGGGLDDPHLTSTQVRRILGHAKQSGAGFVLDVIYWDFAQPTWGQFDPSYMASVDTFVTAAIDSGLTPYIKFQHTPDWVRLCPGPDCDPNSTVDSPPHPALFNAWQSFISDVLDRYPQVKYWGVWNEPNGFSVDTVTGDTTRFLNHNGYATWFDAYYLLFASAADVIQSKPGRVIVGPELGWGPSDRGLSPETEFANFVNALNYRFRPQDILSVHFYGPASDLATRIPVLERSATNAGLSANQIWVTEVGDGSSAAEGSDDSYQAHSVTAFYQTFLSSSVPQWTKLFKFSLWNIWEFELIRNANTASPTFRPAYFCYQALARQFTLPNGCN